MDKKKSKPKKKKLGTAKKAVAKRDKMLAPERPHFTLQIHNGTIGSLGGFDG